jgi:predicted O-methyltransferase YrrM
MLLTPTIRSLAKAVLPPVVTTGLRRVRRSIYPDSLDKSLIPCAAPASPPVSEKSPSDGAAYQTFCTDLNLLLIADALSKLLAALKGRDLFQTAYIGYDPQLFKVVEALQDFGFQAHFFAGKDRDVFHRALPLAQLDPVNFDLAVVSDVDPTREEALAADTRRRLADYRGCTLVGLRHLASAHMLALQHLQREYFFTCLNPRKMSLIAAALYLTPRDGAVIECGVYLGGTTIYMGLLQKFLVLSRPIYALDTFEGMPEPTAKDFGKEEVVYRAGLFSDTRLSAVSWMCCAHGLESGIRLVPGLVQETLPHVLAECRGVAFAFLDTDQYAGTKAGLDHVVPVLSADGLIIVDDTTVHGVDTAIAETVRAHGHLKRRHISGNFDLLFRR